MKSIILVLALIFISSCAYAQTTSVCVDFPTQQIQEIIDYFAQAYGYKEQVRDRNGGVIPNPETKQEFLERYIHDVVIIDQIQGIQKNEAAKQAIKDKQDELDQKYGRGDRSVGSSVGR